MSGISPPMVHPGMLLVGAPAELAVRGLSASPSAQSIKINSRITPPRIGAKACLSMMARCDVTQIANVRFPPKADITATYDKNAKMS